MKHLTKNWDGLDDLECGQYSVSMATDKPLEDVYKAVGRRGGTNITLLLKALMRLGFEYEEVSAEKTKEGRGIVIIENAKKTRGHAVAWEGAKVYDPDGDDYYDDMDSMVSYFSRHDMNLMTIIRVKPVQFREFEVGGRENAEV